MNVDRKLRNTCDSSSLFSFHIVPRLAFDSLLSFFLSLAIYSFGSFYETMRKRSIAFRHGIRYKKKKILLQWGIVQAYHWFLTQIMQWLSPLGLAFLFKIPVLASLNSSCQMKFTSIYSGGERDGAHVATAAFLSTVAQLLVSCPSATVVGFYLAIPTTNTSFTLGWSTTSPI